MASYKDIPKFPKSYYTVSIAWDFLEDQIAKPRGGCTLNMDPDFQRGHVWTEDQQIAFVEYRLMGGESGGVIITNFPGWMGDFKGPFDLIDGKQRITAVRRFLNNEIRVFGRLRSEFEDDHYLMSMYFDWRVMCLESRADILQVYLNLNAGGTPHSPMEITKVRLMLWKELEKTDGRK